MVGVRLGAASICGCRVERIRSVRVLLHVVGVRVGGSTLLDVMLWAFIY